MGSKGPFRRRTVHARSPGLAPGDGVGLACACGIAVAADKASFAASEVHFGILPAVIGPDLDLAEAVGRRRARHLAPGGASIAAARARALGRVQRAVSADPPNAAVDEIVRNLRSGDPAAQREIRAFFAPLGVGAVGRQTREFRARTIARVCGAAAAREGFAANLGKRSAPRAS